MKGFSNSSNELMGPVNLPNCGQAKTGRCPLALRGDARFGDLAPRHNRLGSQRLIVG
jgi:hypothetical protein